MKSIFEFAVFRILFCTAVIFGVSFKPVSCAKILSVEFFGSKSHVITYMPLLEELAVRGHEVTVVAHTEGLAKEKSIREISTLDSDIFGKEMNNSMLFRMKERNELPNPFTMLTEMLPKFCGKVYDRADIKGIMEEQWDLVLIQPVFNECALGYVHRIIQKNKAALVIFTPASAPNFVVEKLGGFHPDSFVSNVFAGFPDEMTFWQRFQNFGFNWLSSAILSFYYVPIMEAVYREKLGADIPSSDEILGTASIILANGHFSLSRPKPNLPDVIDVGGIHSRPAKPLPKDFEDFVSRGGKHGFILFSLGSNLRGDMMSEAKRNIFLNVFAKLKQQVIWKFETNDMIPNLPKNILLSKWFPQQDLLGHPSIKMFITHCGLGGTEEAIYHGVPLLGMPFFGDQPNNAKDAEQHGILVKLDWNDLTEELLMDTINEILNNPKYSTSVKKLSTVFRDQIDDPLKRGAWWIEYVLRHKGAPHLRSAARKLNYFQYHCWDVLAAYIALIGAVIWTVYKFLKVVTQKICRTKSKTLQQNEHKKYN